MHDQHHWPIPVGWIMNYFIDYTLHTHTHTHTHTEVTCLWLFNTLESTWVLAILYLDCFAHGILLFFSCWTLSSQNARQTAQHLVQQHRQHYFTASLQDRLYHRRSGSGAVKGSSWWAWVKTVNSTQNFHPSEGRDTAKDVHRWVWKVWNRKQRRQWQSRSETLEKNGFNQKSCFMCLAARNQAAGFLLQIWNWKFMLQALVKQRKVPAELCFITCCTHMHRHTCIIAHIMHIYIYYIISYVRAHMFFFLQNTLMQSTVTHVYI